MYLGKIVETGSGEEIFADPQHPYTQALLSAAPVPGPASRPRDAGRVVLGGDLPSPLDADPPGARSTPAARWRSTAAVRSRRRWRR